ncbi:Bacterial membrane protein YfhO [Gimesia fumaroli]|uniref:Bacterial membrane protein YfhO n=2 Tax=Gimesia fumaroli TaxID=2527976 RepID=A0A518IBR5_9PLAN|nr:Bacterial membrane protein YfhO [Gimesia fumaroli]
MMQMSSRLFQNLIAALVLAIVSAICFQALVLNPTDVLVGSQDHGHNDTTNQFIAFKSYQKICFEQHDQFPFWNPYSLLGMPWLGSPQSSLFYPPNWVFFFSNALTTISWMLVFHHWWAGWGAYLLGRKYKLCFFSCLLSGIIFLAAPYFVAKTGEGHYTSITQIAWFPWILYGYELLIERRKKAVPILTLLISLAFFCGHVQELYYLLLFLTSAIVIESLMALIQNNKTRQPDQTLSQENELVTSYTPVSAVSISRGWFFAGLLTIGLVAIDLIPVSIYTQQAVRSGGIDLKALQSGSLAVPSLIQLLDPFVWGGPDQYQGPGGYYWETVCYFGCLPLILACLGCVTSIRNRTVLRLTLIGFAAFLLAFGPHLPFYTLCYNVIPGFSMFRIPARLMWICSLVIAMLAGFGCETIGSLFLNSSRKKFRNLSLICFAAGLVCLTSLMISSGGLVSLSLNPGQIMKLQLVSITIAVMGVAAAIFSACLSRKTAISGLILLCILCTWELSLHSAQILRTIPQTSFREGTKIVDFLKENQGQHRVLVGQKLLSDREAWKHQILKVQGYEPVPLVRLGLLAAATFPQPDASLMMAGYAEPQLNTARQPLLNLMSIKYAILQTDQKIELAGWKIVEQGTIPEEFAFRNSEPALIPYLILENTDPLPRTFLTGMAKPLNPNEQSKQIVDSIANVQPRKEVLLSQDVLPAGKRQTYKKAEISNASPNQLLIMTELDAPGYLILSDIFYPGWTARIKEAEVPVLPADFSLRAIPLPAGKHQVQLSYEPPGFKIGCIITVTTLAIILILLLMPFRSEKATKTNENVLDVNK